MKVVAFITLALLIASVSSQPSLNIFPNFCSDLFGASTSNYSSLLNVSLLIVLVVLTILGITYAFGIAFGIEPLKAFTRSEFLVWLFNILIIIVVSSGLAFAGAAIAFISNVGLVGIQSISSQSGITVPPVPVSSAYDVYMAICQNYIGNGVGIAVSEIMPATVTSFILSTLQGLQIKLMPYYFGLNFQPFAGIEPVMGLMTSQINIFYAMLGIFVALSLLLFIIYSIFPIFLYVGILLRSFPWTRAAGGTLLAMFISFYIVFPAILYPFSLYMPTITASLNLGLSTSWISLFSFSAILAVVPFSTFVGTFSPVASEISGFAHVISTIGLQLLGLIIAFVISLDLVEKLGDLLGAPSLHTRKLLGKII
jgi:hypothetical protein